MLLIRQKPSVNKKADVSTCLNELALISLPFKKKPVFLLEIQDENEVECWSSRHQEVHGLGSLGHGVASISTHFFQLLGLIHVKSPLGSTVAGSKSHETSTTIALSLASALSPPSLPVSPSRDSCASFSCVFVCRHPSLPPFPLPPPSSSSFSAFLSSSLCHLQWLFFCPTT